MSWNTRGRRGRHVLEELCASAGRPQPYPPASEYDERTRMRLPFISNAWGISGLSKGCSVEISSWQQSSHSQALAPVGDFEPNFQKDGR